MLLKEKKINNVLLQKSRIAFLWQFLIRNLSRTAGPATALIEGDSVKNDVSKNVVDYILYTRIKLRRLHACAYSLTKTETSAALCAEIAIFVFTNIVCHLLQLSQHFLHRFGNF